MNTLDTNRFRSFLWKKLTEPHPSIIEQNKRWQARLVSFTTLGFGDIILPSEWRILSGMTAANGFLVIGMMSAVVLETLRVVRKNQLAS